MNREDSVLDEIDRLVDESLSRGDQSDSFHGLQMRENQPCPWCPEPWHFLPITENLVAMRHGSYATDEFGQGIVDPDYSYRDDQSGVVCPGSEYFGPPHFTGQWDKQRRERMAQGAYLMAGGTNTPVVRPTLPPGRRRRLRFIGPFEPWTIALDDDRVIEDVISDPSLVGMPGYRRRIPVVQEQRLTATFELNDLLRNPSPEWLSQNFQDVQDSRVLMMGEDTFVTMKPIVIPFAEFVVHANDPNADFPDWVEFETTYPIERHPWFMVYWQDMSPDPAQAPENRRPRLGAEADTVIIDEAYEMREHQCCSACEPAVGGHEMRS